MLKKRILLITGSPGVGKTTLLLKVAETLKANGYGVGGMISRDVRTSGSRVGFEVTDLNSGNKGWLASVQQERGPQVGKYRVNVDDLNGIGVKAIVEAVEKLDVVVVDEIGPMELFSVKFREAVKKAVESKKLVVSTIHWKMSGELIDSIKKREDAEIHVLTNENRGRVLEEIVREALDFLSRVDG
ncbi:MAG: NTPase [Candidatus Bathyarchaeia archaeon]|jgi:nucleoside-triphosphatase